MLRWKDESGMVFIQLIGTKKSLFPEIVYQRKGFIAQASTVRKG
jgi:hypothetical protein